MHLNDDPPGRRRRGAELEQALLEAAWQELVDHGYAALTIDGVARRAATSRTVVYRRWSAKSELVRDAVAHVLRKEHNAAPDTGNLRDDLVATMRGASNKRIGISATVVYYLGGYFQETGTSPADLRASMLGNDKSLIDVVIDRAIERGEITGAVTERQRRVAMDLFRHEALMTLKTVPRKVVEEIVDEVVMPLFTHANS